MPTLSRLPLLLCIVLISACSPTTPLFIAQITTNEVVEYKTMKAHRMQAAKATCSPTVHKPSAMPKLNKPSSST
jgi:hypothetical protein